MGLPRYQSHKIVEAFQIAATQPAATEGCLVLAPTDTSLPEIVVPKDYVDKHNPQVGGYFVRYADGYESWSPAEAFEEGYRRVPDAQPDELARRFNYHRPPDEIAVGRHATVRHVLQTAAGAVRDEIRAGVGDRGAREYALFLTKIEEAMFWANAALARNWPAPTD